MDFMFFWGIGDTDRIQKGCLSQWWPCRFSVDGVEYNCAEQYMMASKARTFGDSETFGKIMQTSKPKLIKSLGRQVRNFDERTWDAVKYDVVVDGNMAKFSQNPELKSFLLSTGDAKLVEASPVDRIWGVGLAENDPSITDETKWQGLNLLGKALMAVRARLKTP